MKKHKQSFSKFKKVTVANLNFYQKSKIIGGTNPEITENCGGTDTGGQGGDRTADILCKSDPQVTQC